MTTLTTIQTLTQFWANDSQIDLTSGTGLALANEVYQDLCGSRRWPELTQQDTSISTVSGTEYYTWPTNPVFKEEPYVEFLDSTNSNQPVAVLPAPNEEEYTELGVTFKAHPPIFYRKLTTAGAVKIGLRPIPDRSSDTIRITGRIEATEFTNGASSTIFLNIQSNRALSILIAAALKKKRGEVDRAMVLEAEAKKLLPRYDYNPRRQRGQITPWVT